MGRKYSVTYPHFHYRRSGLFVRWRGPVVWSDLFFALSTRQLVHLLGLWSDIAGSKTAQNVRNQRRKLSESCHSFGAGAYMSSTSVANLPMRKIVSFRYADAHLPFALDSRPSLGVCKLRVDMALPPLMRHSELWRMARLKTAKPSRVSESPMPSLLRNFNGRRTIFVDVHGYTSRNL